MNSIRQDSPVALDALRAQLAQRFPQAHRERPPAAEEARRLATGIPALDRAGLPQQGIVEMVSRSAACGSGLCLWQIVRRLRRAGHAVAFIDGGDGLAPEQWPASVCAGLLWLRCRAVDEAMKAADLVLRDGNLRHLIMDLQLSDARQLRRLPAPLWHRLRHLTEETGTLLLAVTPAPLIAAASLRVVLESACPLESLHVPRRELLDHVAASVSKQRARQCRQRRAG